MGFAEQLLEENLKSEEIHLFKKLDAWINVRPRDWTTHQAGIMRAAFVELAILRKEKKRAAQQR